MDIITILIIVFVILIAVGIGFAMGRQSVTDYKELIKNSLDSDKDD